MKVKLFIYDEVFCSEMEQDQLAILEACVCNGESIIITNPEGNLTIGPEVIKHVVVWSALEDQE